MPRHRSTRIHHSKKPRPQAPPKKEKPGPFRPNISPEEAERRSKLSPEERAAEAFNAGVEAEARLEEDWWRADNYDADGDDLDGQHSFFRSLDKAPDSDSDPEASAGGGGSSKFFISSDSESGSSPNPKHAYKAARHAERQAKKRAANQAEAEAEARRRREEEEGRSRPRSPPFVSADKPFYWFSFLLSQIADAERYGVYYLALNAELTAFKANPSSSPFPDVPKLGCSKKKKKMDCPQIEELNGCCICEFEKVLRGSGRYSEEWIRRERFKWHPDRFSGEGESLEQARVKAAEVSKLFKRILD